MRAGGTYGWNGPGMFSARFGKVLAIRRTTFPISDVANSVSDVLT